MALRYDGYEVNMVGSRQHGTDMEDNVSGYDHPQMRCWTWVLILLTGPRSNFRRKTPRGPPELSAAVPAVQAQHCLHQHRYQQRQQRRRCQQRLRDHGLHR